jgi:uncharacterized protein
MGSGPFQIKHPGILIRINQYYRDNISADELYEITRGVWKININRAKGAKFAFALYKGVIREVYEIHGWQKADKSGYSIRTDLKYRDISKRKEFIGKRANDEIREMYRYKSVAHLFKKGNQNPINYINC